MIATLFPVDKCMDDLKRNVTLIHTLHGPLMCLALFSTFQPVIHGSLYNQALAGVWSTGAGNNCVYCINDEYLGYISFQSLLIIPFQLLKVPTMGETISH